MHRKITIAVLLVILAVSASTASAQSSHDGGPYVVISPPWNLTEGSFSGGALSLGGGLRLNKFLAVEALRTHQGDKACLLDTACFENSVTTWAVGGRFIMPLAPGLDVYTGVRTGRYDLEVKLSLGDTHTSLTVPDGRMTQVPLGVSTRLWGYLNAGAEIIITSYNSGPVEGVGIGSLATTFGIGF